MDEHPPLGLSPTDWAATPPAVKAALLALMAQVAALQTRVADLEARLNQHSGNSSKPPSSDPPSAPPRPAKPPRGRQRGAQPGHAGHHRPLLPPDDDRIQEIVAIPPAVCRSCATALASSLPDARPPERRQVWEIPPREPRVTEYQLRAVACPACGDITRAMPPAGMPPLGYGPRAVAITALLHARARQSDRATAELMDTLFGLPMAVGTVTAVERAMSAALAQPYAEVQAATQTASRANVDETGWKQGIAGVTGKRKGWLWVAVTQLCTLFLVWTHRDAAAVDRLLGTAWRGIITSDRWCVYNRFLLAARQLCWAHLIRDIRRFADYARDGPIHAWGVEGLTYTEQLFGLWHRYRTGALDRTQLQQAMQPIQAAFHGWLERGKAVPYEKARAFSRDLGSLEAALWTFVRVEGVEPTNNAAERALRPAVVWRKLCFGSQSTEGARYVERMLTVIATCKQQNRHLLTFLTEAVEAHWTGTASPTLIQIP